MKHTLHLSVILVILTCGCNTKKNFSQQTSQQSRLSDSLLIHNHTSLTDSILSSTDWAFDSLIVEIIPYSNGCHTTILKASKAIAHNNKKSKRTISKNTTLSRHRSDTTSIASQTQHQQSTSITNNPNIITIICILLIILLLIKHFIKR